MAHHYQRFPWRAFDVELRNLPCSAVVLGCVRGAARIFAPRPCLSRGAGSHGVEHRIQGLNLYEVSEVNSPALVKKVALSSHWPTNPVLTRNESPKIWASAPD